MKEPGFGAGVAAAAATLALCLPSQVQAQEFTVRAGEVAGQQVMANPGDTGVIEPGGRIVTSGAGLNGVDMLNAGQSIAIGMGGAILTSSNNAAAIFSTGAEVEIVNSGMISTTGDGSDGVSSFGLYASIRNDGTIQTAGSRAVGILTGAAGANIVNAGSIISRGPQEAYGVAAIGDGSVIRNNGLIQAGDAERGGLASIGVLSVGMASEIQNSGDIRAFGIASYGILSDGGQAVISNAGRVAASGRASVALLSAGDGSTIVNSGLIESNGLAAIGILSSGDGTTIINSGRIMADISEFAILMTGSDAALSLGAGTVIQGKIGFAGVNGSLEIGNGLNTALTFVMTPAFVDTNGAPSVISGNVLATVDPTGFSAQDEMLAETTHVIADAVDGRLDAVRIGGGAPSPAKAGIWAAALGGYLKQQQEGAGSDFGYRAGGLMLGIDTPASESVRLGMFAGAMTGEMTADTQSQSIHNDNYFGGAYLDLSANGLFLDLSATAGLAAYDSRRRVANNRVEGGIEYARASYDGIFLSPAATIGSEIPLWGGVMTPSIRARHASLFLGDYEESGSAANLEVESRRVGIFELRGQLAYAFAPVETVGGRLDWSVRMGVDAVSGGSGEADAVLMGQPLEIATHDDEIVTLGFAGARVLYTSEGGVQAGVSGEAGAEIGGSFSVKAQAEISVPF